MKNLYNNNRVSVESRDKQENYVKKCKGMGIPILNEHLYTLSFKHDQVVITHDEDKLPVMLRIL